jgi:hypothetical protein
VVRILLYAVPVILGVWALVDCAQTAKRDVRRLPRAAWILIILMVPIVGPVAWLTVGRRKGSGPRPAPRPVAPDDDPDFLRDLDRKKPRSDDKPGETPSS